METKIKFKGQRIDNDQWVEGYYFKTPLTDENSGTDPSVGWFFLTGETRHCISSETGVVFVVKPESVAAIEQPESVPVSDIEKLEIEVRQLLIKEGYNSEFIEGTINKFRALCGNQPVQEQSKVTDLRESLAKAFEAGREYQMGEYSEYHGGHEHDKPDKKVWIDEYLSKIKPQ